MLWVWTGHEEGHGGLATMRCGSAAEFVPNNCLLYLPEVPPLPEPVRVRPVEDQGTLLLLTPERLTASNPEHLALGRHVQELLRAKGLLEPVVSRQPAT